MCLKTLSALLSSKSNLGARYKYVSENKGADRLIMFKKKKKEKNGHASPGGVVACCWARNPRKIKRNNGRDHLTNSQIFFFFFAIVLQNLQHVIKRTTHGTADRSEVISPVTNTLKAFQPIRFLF